VDVVVLVLVHVLTKVGLGPLNIAGRLHVLVHRALLVKFRLVLWEHLFLVLADLSLHGGVDVLGGEGLGILNGLHSVLAGEGG